LTTGLCYQNDRIERAGSSVIAPTPVDSTQPSLHFCQGLACLCRERRRDRGALVNRGYNPGGVSLNLNARRWQPFEEETIWSYALFTPATLLDDRLTLNSNLFYMDFKNAQYTIPVAILPGWSR